MSASTLMDVRPDAKLGCEEAALDYQRRGFSPIPISPSSKKAAKGWKEYQRRRATEEEIRYWFRDGSEYNVAVVMGEISGGLGVRDFDTDGTYDRWAAKNPLRAKTLPTVRTGRPGGHHVYFRMTEEVLAEIREEFSRNGRGAIDLGDGELRCDEGCYVVAPPSRHPDGSLYRWEVPLGDNGTCQRV